jgi:hypothetical protein
VGNRRIHFSLDLEPGRCKNSAHIRGAKARESWRASRGRVLKWATRPELKAEADTAVHFGVCSQAWAQSAPAAAAAEAGVGGGGAGAEAAERVGDGGGGRSGEAGADAMGADDVQDPSTATPLQWVSRADRVPLKFSLDYAAKTSRTSRTIREMARASASSTSKRRTFQVPPQWPLGNPRTRVHHGKRVKRVDRNLN